MPDNCTYPHYRRTGHSSGDTELNRSMGGAGPFCVSTTRATGPSCEALLAAERLGGESRFVPRRPVPLDSGPPYRSGLSDDGVTMAGKTVVISVASVNTVQLSQIATTHCREIRGNCGCAKIVDYSN